MLDKLESSIMPLTELLRKNFLKVIIGVIGLFFLAYIVFEQNENNFCRWVFSSTERAGLFWGLGYSDPDYVPYSFRNPVEEATRKRKEAIQKRIENCYLRFSGKSGLEIFFDRISK